MSFDKISGMLVYVQVNRPVKAYQKAGSPAKPDEWKASVVVTDEDFIDEFEEYAKGIDAKVSLKKVKSSEFETLYKTAAPEGAGKNVWVLTFRKSTELGSTGKLVPDLYKPKVYERVGNKLIDVTNSKLPANGSYGTISTELFNRQNGTASIYLKNVLVTDMIEYIREDDGEAYEPGSEFEDVVEAKPAAKPAAKVVNKPAAKVAAKKAVEVDEEEDIPF